MNIGFTITQKERLVELGANELLDLTFADKGECNRKFIELEKALCKESRKKVEHLLAEKRASDAWDIQCKLEKWLMEEMGFTKVSTPTIISGDMLDKMSITDENPLREQVFWIEDNKCLRPMLAPNLYVVMRELHRITNKPVRIFEAGSCFRKESQGAQHLNEFTMLNFVEFATDTAGRQMERLEFLAKGAMAAVGIDEYELVKEGSVVYEETLDIMVSDVELASGSYGPHKLDSAWGVFEPWVGLGFGIERLAFVKGNHKTIKRVGKSIMFIDGVPLSI
jgi:phenylalanyl-tRNA synthetase alpha chain